jgi:hypothetical protein
VEIMARSRSGGLTAGVLLVAIGGVLLATRLSSIESAPAWLMGLGLAFALLAVLRRTYGALVAGCVMIGLGAGMLLGDEAVAGLPKNAWSLLGLGLGFLGLYLVDLILRLRRHWWPLVPGVVLVAMGGARLVSRVQLVPPAVEAFVRLWWPVGLVAVGAWLLVRSLR